MKVVTDRNEEYECFLPNLSSKVSPEIDDLERPNPLELIYPLFAQRSCTYRLESYWTYELCHGRFVRQFHEEREGQLINIALLVKC